MSVLVIRTSAMGDVALTVPVLSAMRQLHPDVELLMITRPAFHPFFLSLDKMKLFRLDLKGRHKGFIGIIKLYRDISKDSDVDKVIDLHDVLRSKILRFFFSLSGIKIFVIDKGRVEKKALIKGVEKNRLKHSVERYRDVFERAGYTLSLSKEKWIIPSGEVLGKTDLHLDSDVKLNIGVAPFAKHKLKMWPEENMLHLLQMIGNEQKTKFWLFGGLDEKDSLAAFREKLPGSVNLAGMISLEEELALMSRLDLMIAMDSSNMHMAALVDTKIISIWGATDPLSGFGAWMQPEEYSISISAEELTCRPCTIYGKGECARGDFACMKWLTPEIVFERIKKLKLL